MIHRFLFALAMLLLATHSAAADPGNYPRLALTNVLIAEGGYANHPSDPGGRTLHGIIQRVYDADRAARGLPSRTITPTLATDTEFLDARDRIYRVRYWEPCAGPILPRGVDFAVFTMCVNAGISRGWSMLMKVLGLPTARPWASHAAVLKAIEAKGQRATIRLYGDERRRFYRVISPNTRGVFLAGWLDREARERRAAINMVSGLVQGSGVEMARTNLRMGKAVEDAGELLEVIP